MNQSRFGLTRPEEIARRLGVYTPVTRPTTETTVRTTLVSSDRKVSDARVEGKGVVESRDMYKVSAFQWSPWIPLRIGQPSSRAIPGLVDTGSEANMMALSLAKEHVLD